MAQAVDILILGAGWTSTFLVPLCLERSLIHAATTRTGRDETIAFTFDPDLEDAEAYRILPDAGTVLITFPIIKPGSSARLVRLYRSSRSDRDLRTGFIQLGTTGIWDGARVKMLNAEPPKPVENKWFDRHTPYTSSNERALAEAELLEISSPQSPTSILNLAGLWGGARSPRNWVPRVAPSKEALKHKGSIHLTHGLDVARAVLAVHGNWEKAAGQRWILSDGRVYDWWDLASAWGSPNTGPGKTQSYEGRGIYAEWVRELMQEENVRALPRDIGYLGRALDSRDFWSTFGLSPLKARLE
ncbi:hypothetical protein DXG01_001374 [Tephrocybe rancida]|nr:hypothetical protein DXG01_001374 [Tephrocybe rancida]